MATSINENMKQKVYELLNKNLDITQDELIGAILQIGYTQGYIHGEEDAKDPVYCPVCGSCGESGCCPPDKCLTAYVSSAFETIKDDYNHTKITFNAIRETVTQLVTHGQYCDYNVKEYRDIVKECDKYYNALEEIKNATYASQMVVIATNALK